MLAHAPGCCPLQLLRLRLCCAGLEPSVSEGSEVDANEGPAGSEGLGEGDLENDPELAAYLQVGGLVFL